MIRSVSVSMTIKTAEAAENAIRNCIEAATDMPEDEWQSLALACQMPWCYERALVELWETTIGSEAPAS